jgi:hypothetical protein
MFRPLRAIFRWISTSIDGTLERLLMLYCIVLYCITTLNGLPVDPSMMISVLKLTFISIVCCIYTKMSALSRRALKHAA